MAHNLDEKRLAFTLGIIGGITMLLMSLGAFFLGWGLPMINIISSLYLGYELTFKGILIGILWGALDGVILGFLIAAIYNFLDRE